MFVVHRRMIKKTHISNDVRINEESYGSQIYVVATLRIVYLSRSPHSVLSRESYYGDSEDR